MGETGRKGAGAFRRLSPARRAFFATLRREKEALACTLCTFLPLRRLSPARRAFFCQTACLGLPGACLGSSWACLGHLGAVLPHLGLALGHLGVCLGGSPWACLGSSWGPLPLLTSKKAHMHHFWYFCLASTSSVQSKAPLIYHTFRYWLFATEAEVYCKLVRLFSLAHVSLFRSTMDLKHSAVLSLKRKKLYVAEATRETS